MTFDDFLGHLEHVTGLGLVGASPTTPIDAEVDSLGLVLLLMDLDDQAIPVPDELMATWETLGDLYVHVRSWGASATRSPAVERGVARDPLEPLTRSSAQVETVPVLPEHVPVLHELASRGRNAFAWWPRGRSVSLGEFEERLWHDAVLQELVVERATGRLLGLVRIADYDERNGHAQLMAMGADHGRSRFIEGATLVVARAFTMWPLHKLYLMVPAYNDVLLAPRERLLVPEGCLKGHEYFDGRRHDLRIYALYRETFQGLWRASGPWASGTRSRSRAEPGGTPAPGTESSSAVPG